MNKRVVNGFGMAWVVLACTAAVALEGSVQTSDGEPIVGARVCYIIDKVELVCVNANSQGRFEIPTSQVDTLRAHAPGYLPTAFSGAGLRAPVVLQRAPILTVRLVDDSSGDRIDSGEVFIVYPSGKRKGPFPTNAAGVRISRLLESGDVRVLAEADGYRPTEPREVELVAGQDTQVTLRLVPDSR